MFIIEEASMGVEVNAQNDPNSRYVTSVKRISAIFFKRVFSILKTLPTIYQFTPLGMEESKLIKHLHNFTNNVITKRRQTLLAKPTDENVNKVSSDDFNVKKKLSMLDMLLSATVDGEGLPNEGIREEVDTFMFAVCILIPQNQFHNDSFIYSKNVYRDMTLQLEQCRF